jgi:hypothetical protein
MRGIASGKENTVLPNPTILCCGSSSTALHIHSHSPARFEGRHISPVSYHLSKDPTATALLRRLRRCGHGPRSGTAWRIDHYIPLNMRRCQPWRLAAQKPMQSNPKCNPPGAFREHGGIQPTHGSGRGSDRCAQVRGTVWRSPCEEGDGKWVMPKGQQICVSAKTLNQNL